MSAVPRPHLLLVEDSEDDAFFFRWSLEKCGLECDLVHVSDGAAAIAQLERWIAGKALRPDLVFLDLKIPAFSGFEVLEWIRARRFQPPLDVAILSGSEHKADVDRALKLGATAYHVKPVAGEKLISRFAEWRAKQARPSPDRSHDVSTHATLA